MNERFGRKNNNTMKMLVVGLVILVFSLGVCLALILSLKKDYSEDISGEFHSRHNNASSVIDSKFEDVSSIALSFASILETDGEFPSNNRIYEAINHYEGLDDASYVFFISVDNQVYHNGRTVNKNVVVGTTDWNEIKTDFKGIKGGESVFIRKNDFGYGDGERIYLFVQRPVYYYSLLKGQIVVATDVTDFFSDSAFDYQNQLGTCFITDSAGKVLIGNESSISDNDISKESVSADTSCIDYFVAMSDGKYKSVENINSLLTILEKNDDGYITFTTQKGYVCQVSISKLNAAPGLYFVSCYGDNIVSDRIFPLMIRSVLACILIIFLMIMINFYVWYAAKRTNITIERLAYMDFVTDGKNVNYFKEFAVYTVEENKEIPFAIYRTDILNFRYINEAYGHIRADGILKLCIKCFEEVFTNKELCVRMDSDQFLALVVNDRSLDQKVEQFNEKVNQNARGLGIKYPIRFKVGICLVKKHERNIDVLIDHANVARKTIKGDEKVMRAVYSDKIVNDMRKIDRIESEQQRALATDEFKVFLQPKWNIRENRIMGAEALVRWIKNDGSMVYPDEFIPVFENNGFIEKLDFYMLEKVCIQLKERIEAGLPIYPISVNQSRMMLHSSDYVKNVEKILRQNNIPAGYIELELTETVFTNETELMINTMKELKKLGVRISMDDFGSGYSSLNMLKDIPFDLIKIDREFFSESVTSEASLLILQKIIEMADGLNLQVICEGVETGEQVILLQTIGCSYVQGYYYSKPLPSDDYYTLYCGG